MPSNILIFWLKSHVSVEFVHVIVLSVVPFNVIPPPSAVKSVSPPTVNVIAPAVSWFALAVNYVALSTLVIVAPPELKAPLPEVFVNVAPGR